MARRAVIDKSEFILNEAGQALVDAQGKKIRRVIWHWENIPEEPAKPTERNPGYKDEELQALYERHLKHGALGELVPVKPKRYLLHFDYADGQAREVEASVAEAMHNEAIGRSLYSAPLVHCSTTLIQES